MVVPMPKSLTLEKGSLTVTGTHTATVQRVERIKFTKRTEIESAIRKVIQLLFPELMSGLYSGGCSMFEAYYQSLCCSCFAEQSLPAQLGVPEFQQSQAVLSSILGSQEVGEASLGSSQVVKQYLGLVTYFCSGRSLFTTEEGFIGLAPPAVRQGDHVCILLGSKTP